MSSKDVSLEINSQWAEIQKEILTMVSDQVEAGLDAAAAVMVEELERVSPYHEHSGEHLRNSWAIKKYPKKRYVGSTKKVRSGSKQIPLASLLEYGRHSKHKGFMRKAFNNAKPRLIQAFKNSIRR